MLRGWQRAGSHKRERSRETSGRAHEEREGLPVEGSHRALVRRLCVMFVYFDELECRIIGFVARSICPLRSNPSALRSNYEFARHFFRMLLIK